MNDQKLHSPKVMKEIINKHGFKFNKRLGQNFLIDGNIVNKICDSAKIDDNTAIIEIGPGLGTLTQCLCEKAKKVIAIEIDTKLKKVHKETLDYDNLEIVYEDFLKLDINKLINEKLEGLDVKVVANLPYYITTPIIMKILEEKCKVSEIVIMVQKEVAQRLTAKAGTKEYGAITLAVQYYSKPEIAMIVPNTVFIPKPKVDSAVITFGILKEPSVKVDNEKLLFEVIKAAFGKRRKTLLNSLSSGLIFSKDIIRKTLEEVNIDPIIRGERLTLEQFSNIANNLNNK